MIARVFAGLLRLFSFLWLRPLTEVTKAIAARLAAGRQKSERERNRTPYPCVPIDRPEFLRPDPLIYSQYYLMALGLAVTWDNPDIHFELNGTTVPSSDLQPATTYDVIARIWNESTSCPVLEMPVFFSYLTFGVGTVSNAIGKTKVDLGVKGGVNCPAYAHVKWRTPEAAGHYCLQVILAPPDDTNPFNNLGQENTQVGVAHSPANFIFTLRNGEDFDREFVFEVDAYTIPDPVSCRIERHTRRRPVPHSGKRIALKQEGFGTKGEVLDEVLSRHLAKNHPLPEGWRARISPERPTLAPGEELPIAVEVTFAAGFHGSRRINVNAFTGGTLAGGVTLIVNRL
jgi:hypothetical protein